jgi:CheY-like chemotaxis protein
MERAALQDRRILVIEDEFLIADDLKDKFADLGAVVLGPVSSVEGALALLDVEQRIDVAFVDMNLGGRMAYEVLDALQVRRIPFILISGYEEEVFRSRYPLARNCLKPYEFADIEKALAAALPP